MTVLARPSVAAARPGRTRDAIVIPLVLGILAVAVAATGSWIPSLWGDEAATAMSAQRSWASLWLEVSHVDAVHATYYVLMHLWVHVAGASPFALRLPSALALGAAVAGVAVLVRVSGGPRTTAIVLGVATMLLPRLAYQGEEARAYAIDAAVATWILVATCAVLRGRIRPPLGWVLVGALTVLGTYLFLYVGLMLLVVAALVLVSGRRGAWRPLVWTAAGVLVACLPIIVFGLRERTQVAFLAHRVTTDPYSLFVTVWFGNTAGAVVGWILVAVALVAGALRWRRRRLGRPWGDDAGPSLLSVAVLWAFLPLGVLVAGNPIAHEFSARYATFTAPGVAMLVGLGVVELLRRRRWVGIGVAVVGVAVAGTIWAGQRTPTSFNASDWSTIGGLVREHAMAGDQVAFDVTVRPSRSELLAMRTYPEDFAGLTSVQVTAPYWTEPTWHDAAMTVDQAVADGRFSDGRLWLLQDAHGGRVDHEGEAALRADGFRVVERWRTPSSELVELER
jgi:mannosyltransferase